LNRCSKFRQCGNYPADAVPDGTEGDFMAYAKNTPAEKDWKLFRKKLPEWQENYMNRLNKEYMEILSQEGKNPSDIFWELDSRIKHDRKLTGVVVHDMSRSQMYIHLLDLLRENVITLDDLLDFSEDLQERLRWLVKRDVM